MGNTPLQIGNKRIHCSLVRKLKPWGTAKTWQGHSPETADIMLVPFGNFCFKRHSTAAIMIDRRFDAIRDQDTADANILFGTACDGWVTFGLAPDV